MIDTVVLMINYPDFDVFEPEKFHPNAKKVLNLLRYSAKVQQYPNKTETLDEGYKPQLTLFKRPMTGAGVHIYMTIQVSVPKLLFGNNFDELAQSDFNQVVEKLQIALFGMGVKVSRQVIATAHVLTIHYGKNYVFTDHTTAHTYIEEIRKADVSQIYDVNQTDFRNEGHSYKFRSNTFELTFYDKVKDLERAKISVKRSVEQNTLVQLGLVNELRAIRHQVPFEVLRFEIRLNGTRKVKSELKRLGFEIEPTFQNMFSKSIAQSVCLDYLKQIRSKLVFTLGRNVKSFTDNLADLIARNPDKSLTFLFTFAAYQEIVAEHDMRTARRLIDPKNRGKWYQFKKKLADVQLPETALKIDTLIAMTKEFKTERLTDYSQFC